MLAGKAASEFTGHIPCLKLLWNQYPRTNLSMAMYYRGMLENLFYE
jgi:hypothetical protein